SPSTRRSCRWTGAAVAVASGVSVRGAVHAVAATTRSARSERLSTPPIQRLGAGGSLPGDEPPGLPRGHARRDGERPDERERRADDGPLAVVEGLAVGGVARDDGRSARDSITRTANATTSRTGERTADVASSRSDATHVSTPRSRRTALDPSSTPRKARKPQSSETPSRPKARSRAARARAARIARGAAATLLRPWRRAPSRCATTSGGPPRRATRAR